MTRERFDELVAILEHVKWRHERKSKWASDRTLREAQTYDDVCEALALLKAEA